MTQLLLIVAIASLKEPTYRQQGVYHIPSRSCDTPGLRGYAVTDSRFYRQWQRAGSFCQYVAGVADKTVNNSSLMVPV